MGPEPCLFTHQATVDELHGFVLQSAQRGLIRNAVEGENIDKDTGVHGHPREEGVDKTGVFFLHFGKVVGAVGVAFYR